MAPRRLHRPRRSQASSPGVAAQGLAGPYLVRSLQLVEGHLHMLHARQHRKHHDQRLAAILAVSDPQAPIWGEFLQLTYLENAREGLITTLQALRQPHGRAW